MRWEFPQKPCILSTQYGIRDEYYHIFSADLIVKFMNPTAHDEDQSRVRNIESTKTLW